ncbi:cysteine hydrolase [Naumannella sp. ID2617S]|nr:cysteine hydrolase [Naumannella sp. ID2617S]
MRENTPTKQRALVVIDVQRDVMATCVNTEQTIANIGSLVEKARGSGVPVVWIRHNDDNELVRGTPGWQIVDELVPAEGEPIVDKRFGDSFAETDLGDRLAELGAHDLVICGAQTDACVRSTFYGGLYRGHSVTLVSDAHTTEDMREWGAGFTPEQSIAVLNLQARFTRLPEVAGSVISTADAFA